MRLRMSVFHRELVAVNAADSRAVKQEWDEIIYTRGLPDGGLGVITTPACHAGTPVSEREKGAPLAAMS